MGAVITGFGVALPGGVDQQVLWDSYFRDHFGRSRAAERIFAGSGVRRRHVVVGSIAEDVSSWSTAARMRCYAEHAPPLGHAAVSAAVADAGLRVEDIGLLTVASCTGYGAPGLDIQLADSLGLRPDVHRLLVGHMGCYAALPALASVADFVACRNRPAVLLCLELTSLHIQPPTADLAQVVCHALFGDAAVAVVVRPEPVGATRLRVVDTSWFTAPGSRAHMAWEITDHGFRLGLSAEVPDLIGDHVETVVDALLAPHGLSRSDVRGWAVHSGGPRILDTVQRRLRLPDSALAGSRQVLAEHGNCSSATLLLILRHLVTNRVAGEHDPVVGMAFGPGLTLAATLFRGCYNDQES